VDNNEWKEACVKLGATPERLAPANITARRQHLPKQNIQINLSLL
jgi:hypothetical protein